MPHRASTLLVLAAASACVSCASLASVSGLLSDALIEPDPRSPFHQLDNERVLREKTRLIADSHFHSSTCFGGVVSSGGALGEPLGGVDIEVAFANGGLRPYTRTDAFGRFHVCVPRRTRWTAFEVLTGTPQYVDHVESARVVFTRSGWSTKDREYMLDTADVDRSLDVALERAESGR